MKIQKVIAYCALHYGADFLPWSIRSVIDSVQEYHVLYSPVGSHSVRVPEPCPETRDQLFKIAATEAGDKLRWHDGDWHLEGQQRDSIYTFAPDADMIIVVDSDEVFAPGLANYLVKLAPFVQARYMRTSFYHYWRSLRRVIRHDPAANIRMILPRWQQGETIYQVPPWAKDDFRVHHFGYAQRSEIVRYKMKVHGHIAELRDNWFDDVFMANAQQDCHPVGSEYWNPEPCDVPHFMADHPFAKLEVVP